jgi:hypothetical protein
VAAVTAVAGGLFGAAYLVVRLGVPRATRIAAAGLLGASVGGAQLIDPDGIDLRILDPVPLAVAAFIGLPFLAATVTAVAVERLARRDPWRAPIPVPQALGRLAVPARVVVRAVVVALIASQAIVLADEVARVL